MNFRRRFTSTVAAATSCVMAIRPHIDRQGANLLFLAENPEAAQELDAVPAAPDPIPEIVAAHLDATIQGVGSLAFVRDEIG